MPRAPRLARALELLRASDRRALVRESLLWSAPAALALAVLAAFGVIDGFAVILGWLIALAAGAYLAHSP